MCAIVKTVFIELKGKNPNFLSFYIYKKSPSSYVLGLQSSGWMAWIVLRSTEYWNDPV